MLHVSGVFVVFVVARQHVGSVGSKSLNLLGTFHVWPTLFLLNVLTALKGTHLYIFINCFTVIIH